MLTTTRLNPVGIGVGWRWCLLFGGSEARVANPAGPVQLVARLVVIVGVEQAGRCVGAQQSLLYTQI